MLFCIIQNDKTGITDDAYNDDDDDDNNYDDDDHNKDDDDDHNKDDNDDHNNYDDDDHNNYDDDDDGDGKVVYQHNFYNIYRWQTVPYWYKRVKNESTGATFRTVFKTDYFFVGSIFSKNNI